MDFLWPKSVDPIGTDTPEKAPIDAEVLRLAGHLIYGEKWHRPLSEALGTWRKKPVLVQMVYQWDKGKKPIPDWINVAMVYILEDAKLDLRLRADTIQELATRILLLTQVQVGRGSLNFDDPGNT